MWVHVWISINSNKKSENEQFALVGRCMAVEVLIATTQFWKLSPSQYSLFHPPLTHTLDMGQSTANAFQGKFCYAFVGWMFLLSFFASKCCGCGTEFGKQETLNVKPECYMVCIATKSEIFEHSMTESTDASGTRFRIDARMWRSSIHQ